MSDDKGLTFEEYRSLYKGVLRHAFTIKNDESELCKHSSDPTFKCAMDQLFRDVLIEFLGKDQECLERYVTFCIRCCRKEITKPTMPVVLLVDIFDSFTLDKCEKMFTYVENGVNIWKEELFFTACKNNLLRMCNGLLRRLSRSQNTIFCGRILLFLAKFFPFSERSGLNIVSEFNLDNVTELGGENDLMDANEDEDMLDENKKNSITIDYSLYCRFWALQDYFRNPNLCYNKVQWKTFAGHSSNVLTAFNSYKLDTIQVNNEFKNKSSMMMEVDSKEDQEKHYFAKFLTNRKLLELQLSDSNFRRCILVQFLILFQYLQSTEKSKLETLELKPDPSEWIKQTAELVYKLISETPPDGKNFVNRVRHILKREELWIQWKIESCPEFQKLKANRPAEIISTDEPRKMLKPRRKRLLGDIIKDYEGQGKFYLGNNELTKLWNLNPDNLESCKGKDRDFIPSLETYLAEAFDQVEKGVTGDQRVVADENFGWRALRLLANRSPHFFTYTCNLINKLPDYLESMIKNIANDLELAKQPNQDSTEDEVKEEEFELMKVEPTDEEQMPIQDADNQSGDYEENSKSALQKALSDEQMSELCEQLQGDWKKLATKLGFKEDEILYFIENNTSNSTSAKSMLQLYFQDDEDASPENLAYILEGLGLTEAALVLKEAEN